MLRRLDSPSPGRRSPDEAGFTLAEVLVSMIIITQIILVAMLLFDFNSRVTRVQTRVAEMQQSLRAGQQEVIRFTRMAGRGGLPVTAVSGTPEAPAYLASRLAISTINNVDATNWKVVPGSGNSPEAMPGSDVLILRGNFSTPLYNATLTSLDDTRSDATTGTIVVNRVSPSHPEQDLGPLREAESRNPGIPEALILLPSTPGQSYAVLELQPDGTDDTADTITLNFKIRGDGSELADVYRSLWTNDHEAIFPMATGTAGYVALLEEYRFYVKNDGGGSPETARPVLSRARLLPGTDLPWAVPDGDDPPQTVLETDVADGVLDLQVSLGFDTPDGGEIGEDGLGNLLETETGEADDWLFNGAADDPEDTPFTVTDPTLVPRLLYVRVTTLARTGGADPKHEEPALARLEDRTYDPEEELVNSRKAKMFRRRFLQTTVDLRNL